MAGTNGVEDSATSAFEREANEDSDFFKIKLDILRITLRAWRERLRVNEWMSFSSATVRPTLILMHAAALLAFFFRPTLVDLVLFAALYLATGFGITIGFHRLLAHRGFECSRLITYILAFLGVAALQGGPVWWVGVHRRHHQVSDREGDPHSPIKNFFEGHLGWMFSREGLPKHPALSRDVATDRFLVWLDTGPGSAVPWLSTAAVCFVVGGLSGVIWGAVVRTVFVWHATWCVNSVCHRWGRRPHRTRENSGNVWWVGLWALGEGWHNNHHANPRAALHNYHWWEIDPSGYVLRLLERFHVIHKVIRAGRKSEARMGAEYLSSG